MDQTYRTELVEKPGHSTDFYIGLGLAMSSSVFIGSSFILTKKGLQQISVRAIILDGPQSPMEKEGFQIECLVKFVLHMLAGRGGFGYLRQWKWWSGLLLMGIGEAANFAAYAFAPATLVTSLGALSVLVSAVLSSYWLSERLNLLGKIGCILCLLGSTVVVIHSPREQEVRTLVEFVTKMQDHGFIAYIALVAVGAIWLVFYASRRWGNTNPLVYITITGTIGSLSVMGCKGLGVGIKQTVAGTSQLTNPALWMILVTVTTCITVQMIYLNRALDVFNTAVVTPLLYVIFTGCVILASAVLFREWSSLSAEDVVGNLCGLLVIVSGIFLLQAFRDLNISTRNLPRARKADVLRNASDLNGSTSDQVNLNVSDGAGIMRSTSCEYGLNANRDYHSRTGSYS